MSAFVDQTLLQLSDSKQLLELLAPATLPPGEPSQFRLLTLFGAVYQLPATAVVRDVQTDPVKTVVRSVEFQRPLFPPRRVQGTWTQTSPNYMRTDVIYESLGDPQPVWLDVCAEVAGLTAVVDFPDTDTVASIALRPGDSTPDALRLVLDLELQPPLGTGVQVPFALKIAILIRDTVDIAAVLRDAKLARGAIERAVTSSNDLDVAELRTPYAPLVIFPAPAPANAQDLRSFFATEGVLIVFESPPT